MAVRCQIPPFVTYGDIFPRPGEIRPLGGAFKHLTVYSKELPLSGELANEVSLRRFCFGIMVQFPVTPEAPSLRELAKPSGFDWRSLQKKHRTLSGENMRCSVSDPDHFTVW